MELKETLQVPATFFFDKIADSALYDVRKQTGRTISRRQLKNLEYIKEFHSKARAKIKIERFIENTSYAFSTSTTKNRFFVSYDIEAINENSCQILYKEEMESYGFIQKINDYTVGLLWGFLRKRRFKAMLKEIEASY